MHGAALPALQLETIQVNTTPQDDQIRATIAKLNAETMKIQAEARWYPFVVLAGVFGIALGIFKLLAG